MFRAGESEAVEAAACDEKPAAQPPKSHENCFSASQDCNAGPQGEYWGSEDRDWLWENIP